MTMYRDIENCTRHATNPKPGDYWSDRLSPVCVVLATYLGQVAFCKATKEVDKDHWTWDLTNIESKTKSEFNKWLSYGSIPGYWGGSASRSSFVGS